MKPLTLLAAAVCSTLVTGCASTSTWSELIGQRYHRAKDNTYPVIVLEVDGKAPPTSRGVARVDAGPRKLVLQGPKGAAGDSDLLRITWDIKPCTRYYVVAFKESRLSTSFTPQIDHEEPIAGCVPGS